MDKAVIADLGRQLFEANETRVTIPPITKTHPEVTVEDAYNIQQELLKCHLAAGRRISGRKIGLTSKAMQLQANVFSPDYGYLIDNRYYINGDVIPAGVLIQPKVEAELAFILNKDLQGPGVTGKDVLAVTEYVIASLEIVDKRYHGFYGHICDNVSDNAFFGAYLLGDLIMSPTKMDLSLIGLVLEQNGRQVATGVGAAVMGHPAEGVAWLANRMTELGTPLKSGELILSGSFVAAAFVQPGDFIRARFSGLGEVSVEFQKPQEEGQ